MNGKHIVLGLGIAIVAALATRGVLWEKDYPIYESFYPLKISPGAVTKRTHADGSEIDGILTVPAYMHWLTKKEYKYEVRRVPGTTKLEWFDGHTWRELPPNTGFLLD